MGKVPKEKGNNYKKKKMSQGNNAKVLQSLQYSNLQGEAGRILCVVSRLREWAKESGVSRILQGRGKRK